MAPWMEISRDKIKDTYENCAPVMGVVNYIADNVGDVMRYLELTDGKGNLKRMADGEQIEVSLTARDIAETIGGNSHE